MFSTKDDAMNVAKELAQIIGFTLSNHGITRLICYHKKKDCKCSIGCIFQNNIEGWYFSDVFSLFRVHSTHEIKGNWNTSNQNQTELIREFVNQTYNKFLTRPKTLGISHNYELIRTKHELLKDIENTYYLNETEALIKIKLLGEQLNIDLIKHGSKRLISRVRSGASCTISRCPIRQLFRISNIFHLIQIKIEPGHQFPVYQFDDIGNLSMSYTTIAVNHFVTRFLENGNYNNTTNNTNTETIESTNDLLSLVNVANDETQNFFLNLLAGVADQQVSEFSIVLFLIEKSEFLYF